MSTRAQTTSSAAIRRAIASPAGEPRAADYAAIARGYAAAGALDRDGAPRRCSPIALEHYDVGVHPMRPRRRRRPRSRGVLAARGKRQLVVPRWFPDRRGCPAAFEFVRDDGLSYERSRSL